MKLGNTLIYLKGARETVRFSTVNILLRISLKAGERLGYNAGAISLWKGTFSEDPSHQFIKCWATSPNL